MFKFACVFNLNASNNNNNQKVIYIISIFFILLFVVDVGVAQEFNFNFDYTAYTSKSTTVQCNTTCKKKNLNRRLERCKIVTEQKAKL